MRPAGLGLPPKAGAKQKPPHLCDISLPRLSSERSKRKKGREQEAELRRLLADAHAYEITKLNEAVSHNPACIQRQALETPLEIAKDPSAKLSLLNMSEPLGSPR